MAPAGEFAKAMTIADVCRVLLNSCESSYDLFATFDLDLHHFLSLPRKPTRERSIGLKLTLKAGDSGFKE